MAQSNNERLPRVLVADPDVGFRRTVSALLEANRFECEGASDGVEALGLASAGAFDLIIANLAMPRVEGPTLVAKLREQASGHGAGLIIVSSERADADEARELLDANAFLLKPIDPEQLVREAKRLTGHLTGHLRSDRSAPADEERPEEITGSKTAVVRPVSSTVMLASSTSSRSTAPSERVRASDTEVILIDSAEWLVGAETDAALSGRLDAVPPADICKILHRLERSGKLQIVCDDGRTRGVIELVDGEVFASYVEVDAVVVASGEPAVARIFGWREGSFRLRIGARGQEPAKSRGRNVDRPTKHVIAEAQGRPFHETAELVTSRLGPFEVVETFTDPPRITVHRARRGAEGGFVRLVIVERPPYHRPPELENLKRLAVPGVARLLSWGEFQDGRQWYEAELPAGLSLEDHVKTRGPFPVDQGLALFEKVLETLHAAKQAGFSHGGLDARRIVLPPSGRPVVLDLGIARELGTLEDRACVRATPPEVWQGRPADALSDLYAVGVLLFFGLTGRYPFDDDNPLIVCNNHLHASPPTLAAAGLAQAAPELEQILGLLLAKTPTARYATAEVARAALETARNRDKEKKAPTAETFQVPAPSGYRFVRRIGKGGSGEVFESVHETLGRTVAIKVISPVLTEEAESRARFLREARMAGSLVHPGVVQVFDAREEHGRLYLVMEFVDGEALKARLAREGSIPEAEAVAIGASVLEAIAAAHERGIVHRDVKPDNLLCSSTGRIKVTDFGLATSLHAPDHLTQHGTVLGTPLYMSPEQCQAKPTDERSDLYSVGATLYHMLAGKPPFTGETVTAIMKKHIDELPVPLAIVAPQVSKPVAGVIERLLAKKPEDRFASAREVLNALFLTSVSAQIGSATTS